MKISIPIYATILFIFCSCKDTHTVDKTNSEKVITISQITTNYNTLIKRVVDKGDIDSYDELFYGFMDANKIEQTDSVMKYSKIMAEKYNYEKAYYDYLKAFFEKYDLKIDYSNYGTIDLTKFKKNQEIQAENWLQKMLNNKLITKAQYDSIKKR